MAQDTGVADHSQRPIRLLSLDGGGIRGLSSILILKEIMKQMNQGVEPGKQLQPWQVFDLIGGTSTGGIIAVMLGILRMNLDDCHKAYIDLSKKIFRPKRGKYNKLMRILDAINIKERFESKVFEETIREIIKKHTGDEQHPLKKKGEKSPQCKIFVTTVLEQNSKPMLLRSYDIEDHSDLLSDGFSLWGACRATSAATSYFEPFAHGNLRFVDGAFAYNNPVFQVMIEAKAMWRDRQMMLVSIGTGKAAGKSLDGNAFSLARTLPKLVTQTENTAEAFYHSHQDMVDRGQYFRFTVDGLGVVELGDYQMVNIIESETLNYLRQGPIGRELSNCIRGLLDTNTIVSTAVVSPVQRSLSITAQETECLKALHRAAGDYESQRIGIDKATPGTCQWIVDHENFQKWVSDDFPSLLWITANPGCGKTVLSSWLVDHLAAKGHPVISFIFKAGQSDREASHQAICGLLHQICINDREAAQLVVSGFSVRDESSFTKAVEKRWDDLCAISRSSRRICIIDALDECSDLSRNRLIDCFLKKFSRSGLSKDDQIKVLVTSRPLPDIEERFSSLRTIRLRGEDESAKTIGDIERVIHDKVENLRQSSILSSDACTLVESTLLEHADSTFLWVSLVLESISRLHSRKLSAIKAALEILPSDLDKLYEKALEGLDHPEQSWKLLQILLAAPTPLSLRGIDIALNINSSVKSISDLKNELEPNAEYTIKKLGRFFVRIAKGSVFLVHETAREFLLKTTCTILNHCEISLRQAQSDTILAKACLWFLLLRDWKQEKPPGPSKMRALEIRLLRPYDHGIRSFYLYAVRKWPRLAQRACHCPGDQQILGSLAARLCDVDSPQFIFWWAFYADYSFFWQPSRFDRFGACMGKYFTHYAAKRGDLAVLEGLLAESFGVSEKNANGLDVLTLSVIYGRTEIVERLLATYDKELMDIGTALQCAIAYNHIDLIETLIRAGVDINARHLNLVRDEGVPAKEFPLTAALPKKLHMEVLFRYGARVQGEAIAKASRRGSLDVLPMLIKRAKQNDMEGLDRGTLVSALMLATEQGHLPVRNYLLQTWPDLRDNANLDAGLQAAAEMSDLDAIRTYEKLGATDSTGRGLQWAAVYGNIETADLLIDISSYSQTQLDSALQGFLDVMVQTCLEVRILVMTEELDLSNRRLYTLFNSHPQTDQGNSTTQILARLLKEGATLRVPLFDRAVTCLIPMGGQLVSFMLQHSLEFCPLESCHRVGHLVQACLWGQSRLVRQILAQGPLNLNQKDHLNMSPLLAAVFSGNEDVVRLLLQHGVDVNEECKYVRDELGNRIRLLYQVSKRSSYVRLEGQCCANRLLCQDLKGDYRNSKERQWDSIWSKMEMGHTESPISLASKLGYNEILEMLKSPSDDLGGDGQSATIVEIKRTPVDGN